MLALEQVQAGTILPVKAQAGARRNRITGTHDGALKVAVNQAPERGKANAAIAKILADSLGLNKSQLELLSGQTSTHKRFLVRELSQEELRARITTILGELDAAGT